MNNIIKLKDFELWKNSNNKMDINNYLTAIIDHYKIPSDFLILFSDLIFPEFIVLEKMIFFKNHFKEDYFNRLKKEKNLNTYWSSYLSAPYNKKSIRCQRTKQV